VGQPCNTPLNLVSNGAGGSPFPAPLDSSDIPNVDTNPGFGDLVSQVIGDAADPSDGWDAAVSALEATIAEWDTAASASEVELDTILSTQIPTLDTTALDNSVASFQATLPTSTDLINAVGAIPTPSMGMVDIGWYPRGAYTATPPEGYADVINGQVKQGGAPFTYTFETEVVLLGTGNINGAELPSPNANFTGARLVSVGAPYNANDPNDPGLQAVNVVIQVDVNPVQPGPWTVLVKIDYNQNPIPPGRVVGMYVVGGSWPSTVLT
jgi:hypothetical protein